MKKQLHPKNAAQKMASYSPGIEIDLTKAKKMIFVTGQIAQDNEGKPIAPDDIEKQTECVFEYISAILKEGDMTLDDVVKAVIYIKNMKDFAKISPIRNKYFANSKPVSTLIEISNTVKQGCDIEIDVIAMK
ncbi:RidA family protein [Candidatus Gracilibacteria bacterium]|nr:RidA family protein [Candidatus Gracilibacteria bacterium]NUJ99244.1 RidA family protein [Candidatus Gracilibacteria bacterium]